MSFDPTFARNIAADIYGDIVGENIPAVQGARLLRVLINHSNPLVELGEITNACREAVFQIVAMHIGRIDAVDDEIAEQIGVYNYAETMVQHIAQRSALAASLPPLPEINPDDVPDRGTAPRPMGFNDENVLCYMDVTPPVPVNPPQQPEAPAIRAVLHFDNEVQDSGPETATPPVTPAPVWPFDAKVQAAVAEDGKAVLRTLLANAGMDPKLADS